MNGTKMEDIEGQINNLKSSGDPSVRRDAAESIALVEDFGAEEIEALAAGLLDSDKGINDICFRALASVGSDLQALAAGYLAPFMEHRNIEKRNLAGDLLMGYGPDAVKPLLPYLREGDMDVRKFACDIIGNIGTADHLQFLYELANDDDINVVSSSFEAMGNIRSDVALSHLFNHYEKNEDLKPVIIDAIGKIGGERAQRFLIDKMIDEEDIFLKIACIDALALGGEDVSICDNLMAELPNASEEIQVIILKTIFAVAFRLEHKITLPGELRYVAHKALFDDDEDIRGAGLLALGQFYIEDDVPPLVSMLSQSDNDTRQMILYNLLANSDENVNRSFFEFYSNKALPDGSGWEFLGLLPILWDYGEETNKRITIYTLVNLILDNPGINSIETIDFLIKLDGPGVIETLSGALNAGGKSASEALEIASNLRIAELKPVLENIANADTELSGRARTILGEFDAE